MSALVQRASRNTTFHLGLWRHRARARRERLSRAWRYFMGCLTADDAQRVMLDCRDPAGWHPLLVLTVEDTLEQAREIFTDRPDLPWLIAEGCTHVERKWESFGDELYEARRWAIELAEGYAVQADVTLVRLCDDIPMASDLEDRSEGGTP